jgi:hypothetical protein
MNPEFVQVMAQIQSVLPFQSLFEPIARPGCWPDPDMLQLQGMNPTEGRSHFSVWAIASAPLVLSFDLNNTALLGKLWPIIAQPEVLEINAATEGGHPGTLIAQSSIRPANAKSSHSKTQELTTQWQLEHKQFHHYLT